MTNQQPLSKSWLFLLSLFIAITGGTTALIAAGLLHQAKAEEHSANKRLFQLAIGIIIFMVGAFGLLFTYIHRTGTGSRFLTRYGIYARTMGDRLREQKGLMDLELGLDAIILPHTPHQILPSLEKPAPAFLRESGRRENTEMNRTFAKILEEPMLAAPSRKSVRFSIPRSDDPSVSRTSYTQSNVSDNISPLSSSPDSGLHSPLESLHQDLSSPQLNDIPFTDRADYISTRRSERVSMSENIRQSVEVSRSPSRRVTWAEGTSVQPLEAEMGMMNKERASVFKEEFGLETVIVDPEIGLPAVEKEKEKRDSGFVSKMVRKFSGVEAQCT